MTYSHQRLVLVFLVAAGVRILVLYFSLGTDDIATWEGIAVSTRQSSLCEAYSKGAHVNHPPLSLLLSKTILSSAEYFNIAFHSAFRITTSLFDFFTALLMLIALRTKESKLALPLVGLFLIAPSSWLISTYHGNTDSIMVCLLLATIVNFQRKHYLLAGIFLGLAVNVKIVALFFILALVAYSRGRDRTSTYTLLLGTLPGLIAIFFMVRPCPVLFSQNVLQYLPFQERWGIPLLLEILNAKQFFNYYGQLARFVVPCVIIFLSRSALHRTGEDVYLVFFRCSAVLLLLAPGFGVQYLLWLLPFAIIVTRLNSVAFVISSSLLLICAYLQFAQELIPFSSIHDGQFFNITIVASIVSYFSIGWLLVITLPNSRFKGVLTRQGLDKPPPL